jgi:hypothetical protein
LVWINGPFPSSYHNINNFCNGLRHFLDPFEHVEADDGYIGEAPFHVKCPKCAANAEENELMQGHVHARHETLNGRFKFKAWEILKQIYRHDILKHGCVFCAITVNIQLTIDSGEPLFAVDYNDY